MGSDVIQKAIDANPVKTYGMIIGNEFDIQRSNNTLYADASFIDNVEQQYTQRILNSGQFYGWTL